MKFTPNLAAIADLLKSDGVLDALEAVGDKIAAETRRTSEMARSEPNRYGDIEVRREDDRVTVSAQGPFAHIDEWGGANSIAHASMRRAAAHHGRFVES